MQNWLQLENKVIIVTGGETGIEKAIADKLSGLSANVISADIHTDSANKQDSIYHIYCDVSSKESVDAMVQKVIARYGKIDVLINNAGVAKPQLFVDASCNDSEYEADTDSFDFIFNINVKGVFLCSQAAAKQFIKQKTKGTIINMSSESGMEGSAGQSIYAASKNAVNSFTRADITTIDRYVKNYNIKGVTCNPTIIIKDGGSIQELVKHVPKDIELYLQVIAQDY